MDSTTKRLSAMFSILTALIFFTIANAQAWQYSQGQEDWGPACFVSQAHTTGDFTLISSQGQYAPVLLISLPRYPRNSNDISVSLNFDNGAEYRLTAFVDDYYGNLYLDLDPYIVNEMKTGRELTIVIQERIRVTASLNNSASALNQFLICANAPDTASPSTSTTTIGQWIPLTELGPGWQPGPNPVDEIEYRISDRGYVELRGRLYLKNIKRAERRGGNNTFRVLLQLPQLNGQKYVFNHYDSARTERHGVGYGLAHRMELNVYDDQLVFSYTETQNPSIGIVDNVTLYGLRIPIE
ncbi:MAG: hypothetical protein AB8B94_11675 [Hyphomicrobiales bacterium]